MDVESAHPQAAQTSRRPQGVGGGCSVEWFDITQDEIEALERFENGEDWTTGYYNAAGDIAGLYADYVRQVSGGQQDGTTSGEKVLLYARWGELVLTGQ